MKIAFLFDHNVSEVNEKNVPTFHTERYFS